MSMLIMNVEAMHLITFRIHLTARGAWEALARRFRSRAPARTLSLRRKINTVRMAAGEDILTFVGRAQAIVWELGALGVVIDDEHLLSVVLSGISRAHSDTRHVLSLQRGLSLDDALEALWASEARDALDLSERRRVGDGRGSALVAEDRGGGAPASDQLERHRLASACFGCHKTGHHRADCPEKRSGGRRGERGRLVRPGRGGADGGSDGGALAGMAMMAPPRAPGAGEAAAWRSPSSNK